MLIFAWNANMTIVFLPGKPSLWMLFAGISLGITVLNCVLDRRIKFQQESSITLPLLILLAVVLITAKLTGGIGLRSLGGSAYGGKKFVYIIAAVIGYFALSSQKLDWVRAQRLASVYFLSGLTSVAANLVYLAGPAFYFLYLIFPVDNAIGHAVEDFTIGSTDPKFSRMPGAAAAGTACLFFMLIRYGLRGLLDVAKPWRFVVAAGLLGLSLLGGFRSVLLLLGLVFLIQFYFEGLFRTKLVVAMLVITMLGAAVLVPTAKHLPLSVQRSLSFLPLDIDSYARANAQGSLEWRFEMWKILMAEIPQYFWLGKGYAVNPSDLYFAEQSIRRGFARDFEGALVAGDYHSGPLSILIPFGIFGVAAFVWFLVASTRLLYRNFRFCDDRLRNINVFLLSLFIARCIFYFVGFGALSSDLAIFVGLVGLSVAINGGVRRPESTRESTASGLTHAVAPA